ncbi:hypothetical protein BCA37_18750 [Mycobacterium sp. djl-10]|nr:hypothetical protein BCA37_18750 [Mycobacterium sp. djl-10]
MTFRPAPETPYDTIVVTWEYDGPDEDVTETVNSLGGKTTTYFVQNDRLPLLQPLRDMKVDERIVEAIEKPLKHVVDAGYSRNDPKPVKAKDDDSADEKDLKDKKKTESPEKSDTAESDTSKAA